MSLMDTLRAGKSLISGENTRRIMNRKNSMLKNLAGRISNNTLDARQGIDLGISGARRMDKLHHAAQRQTAAARGVVAGGTLTGVYKGVDHAINKTPAANADATNITDGGYDTYKYAREALAAFKKKHASKMVTDKPVELMESTGTPSFESPNSATATDYYDFREYVNTDPGPTTPDRESPVFKQWAQGDAQAIIGNTKTAADLLGVDMETREYIDSVLQGNTKTASATTKVVKDTVGKKLLGSALLGAGAGGVTYGTTRFIKSDYVQTPDYYK